MTARTGLTAAGRRVLDAASKLFYLHGINAVGVAQIAETAGVTKKTLYDCFGSKAALVARYLQDRHETWWSYLEQRLVDAERPRAITLFDAYLDHPSLDVSRGCAFLNAAAELPVDHAGRDVIVRHKAAVRSRLSELVAEDVTGTDAEVVAEHVFLIVEGAIAEVGVDGGRTGQARQIAAAVLADHRDVAG